MFMKLLSSSVVIACIYVTSMGFDAAMQAMILATAAAQAPALSDLSGCRVSLNLTQEQLARTQSELADVKQALDSVTLSLQRGATIEDIRQLLGIEVITPDCGSGWRWDWNREPSGRVKGCVKQEEPKP